LRNLFVFLRSGFDSDSKALVELVGAHVADTVTPPSTVTLPPSNSKHHLSGGWTGSSQNHIFASVARAVPSDRIPPESMISFSLWFLGALAEAYWNYFAVRSEKSWNSENVSKFHQFSEFFKKIKNLKIFENLREN
jgi:hypothetical protein